MTCLFWTFKLFKNILQRVKAHCTFLLFLRVGRRWLLCFPSNAQHPSWLTFDLRPIWVSSSELLSCCHIFSLNLFSISISTAEVYERKQKPVTSPDDRDRCFCVLLISHFSSLGLVVSLCPDREEAHGEIITIKKNNAPSPPLFFFAHQPSGGTNGTLRCSRKKKPLRVMPQNRRIKRPSPWLSAFPLHRSLFWFAFFHVREHWLKWL